MLSVDDAVSKQHFFVCNFFNFCNHTRAITSHACSSISTYSDTICPIYVFLTKVRVKKPKYFSSFKGYPLQVRHKQDWGLGFILLLPQTAALPESDAGSDSIKPASSFVIQNHQTLCSMWCPMYKARC